MGAGTRVWVADDVEEYRNDQLFLKRLRGLWDVPDSLADRDYVRSKRLAYVEWRDKWGKFKVAALIAIAGAVITMAVPQLWHLVLK